MSLRELKDNRSLQHLKENEKKVRVAVRHYLYKEQDALLLCYQVDGHNQGFSFIDVASQKSLMIPAEITPNANWAKAEQILLSKMGG